MTDSGKSKKKIKCFTLDLLSSRCLLGILMSLSSRQLHKTGTQGTMRAGGTSLGPSANSGMCIFIALCLEIQPFTFPKGTQISHRISLQAWQKASSLSTAALTRQLS